MSEDNKLIARKARKLSKPGRTGTKTLQRARRGNTPELRPNCPQQLTNIIAQTVTAALQYSGLLRPLPNTSNYTGSFNSAFEETLNSIIEETSDLTSDETNQDDDCGENIPNFAGTPIHPALEQSSGSKLVTSGVSYIC